MTATAARWQLIKHKFCIALICISLGSKRVELLILIIIRIMGKINIFVVLQMSSYTKHYMHLLRVVKQQTKNKGFP